MNNSTPSNDISGTGYMIIRTSTAMGAIPISGAIINISGAEQKNSDIIVSLRSGSNGTTDKTPLPAPPKQFSAAPSRILPYSLYNLEVLSEGFYTRNYVNIPIAFYGGGANLSEVNIENLNMKDYMSEKVNIDLLTRYLKLKETLSLMSAMKNLMMKTVTTVTGFEPFNFIFVKENNYLYGQTPDIDELRDNLKEETK